MTGNSFAFVDSDGNNVSLNINDVYKVAQTSATEISFIFGGAYPQDRVTVQDTLSNLESTSSGVFFQATYVDQLGRTVTECLSVYRVREVREADDLTAIVRYVSASDREETFSLTDTYAAISAIIDGAGAGGSGTTNLGNVPSPTGVQITSSSGTNTTIPGADGTNAGMKLPTAALTENLSADIDAAVDVIEIWDDSAGEYRKVTVDSLLQKDDGTRIIVPAGAFADPEVPTEAEVLTYIAGLPNTVYAGTTLVLTDGSSAKDGSPDNPEVAWIYDGVNVTRTKDISRKYEIEDTAFADPTNPTRTEIITWLTTNSVNANPVLLYNIGSGTEEEPDYTWMISTDADPTPGDIILVSGPSTSGRDGDFSDALAGMVAWDASTVDKVSIIVDADGTIPDPANVVTPTLTRVFFRNSTAADRTVTLPTEFTHEDDAENAITTLVIPANSSEVYELRMGATEWRWVHLSGEGGSSVVQYRSNDAEIWATGAGITFTKAASGAWTFAIPVGVQIIKANIDFALGDVDTANSNKAYVLFDYAGLRTFNTSYGDMNFPAALGVVPDSAGSQATPANYTLRDHGVSSIGGGDGSDLEVTVTNAAVATDNQMIIQFSTL